MTVLDNVLTIARSGLSWLGRRAWWQSAGHSIGWAIKVGTHDYPPETQRRLMIMNMIAYLIAVTTLIYALQHSFMDFEKYRPVIFLNLALVPTAIAVPFAHRFSEFAGGMVLLVSEYIALVIFTYYMGRESGIQLQYFVIGAASFVVFGPKRWKIIIPLIAAALGLQIYAWFAFPAEVARLKTEPEVIDGIYIQAAVTTMLLIAACVYYAFALAEKAKAQVDSLLRNILPDSIVERLNDKPGEAISDSFDDASILFSDISGFVPLARELGAVKVVELLNEIVSEFDSLAQVHGVEKIKTIGDAYMVASGIPEPVPDHAVRLSRMGLDMLQVVDDIRTRTGLKLNIRIGIASGPVMAGVIGTKKFSYDVWGDAVNLAARLENKGQIGRVHICPTCKSNLEGIFEFESRGEIEIKGVGLQETWFLVAEKTGQKPKKSTSIPTGRSKRSARRSSQSAS